MAEPTGTVAEPTWTVIEPTGTMVEPDETWRDTVIPYIAIDDLCYSCILCYASPDDTGRVLLVIADT